MRIQTNITALAASRYLSVTDLALSKSLERLSSGFRINRASDDAAGLAISEKMRAQYSGLDIAARNAMDGISLVQVAEGALGKIGDILQRLRDLAVQAKNGTNSTSDIQALQAEADELVKEIDDIASKTTFNGIKLLDQTGTITLQVGTSDGDTLTIDKVDATSGTLGVSGFAVDSANAISTIDAALDQVNAARATLGAALNRLEHKVANLTLNSENLKAAASRIKDADMASEMAAFAKYQVLMQSGIAMLAQANAKNQAVLALLR